jgi:carbon storage regulator
LTTEVFQSKGVRTMLVLSRKKKQAIVIGDNIRMTVIRISGNVVRIGVEADKDVLVLRGEVEKRDVA